MARPKKPKARADQPRNSRAVRELKEDLGLDEADWQEFLRHALDGFADYEEDRSYESDFRLRMRDAPAEWFESPEPLGFVTLRVLKEGKPDLAARVAYYFLQICEPGPNESCGPAGIGASWLYLAREGVNAPVEPAGLAHLALQIPQDFFKGVAEDDLLPLSRLILESVKPREAWDLHALLAGIAMARIHVRAPFRLFDGLMSCDAIPIETRKEFCRGVLECPEEAQRLRERGKALRASFQTGDDWMSIPRTYLELQYGGIGRLHPGLKRHAVRALVEDLGEPLEDVIAEFFLQEHSDQQSTVAVSEGVLDLIRLHADELGPEVVKRRLNKAIKEGLGWVRRAAYRVGMELFGPAFARPALKDSARMVRDWAAQALSKDKTKRGPKSRSRKPAPGDSPDE